MYLNSISVLKKLAVLSLGFALVACSSSESMYTPKNVQQNTAALTNPTTQATQTGYNNGVAVLDANGQVIGNSGFPNNNNGNNQNNQNTGRRCDKEFIGDAANNCVPSPCQNSNAQANRNSPCGSPCANRNHSPCSQNPNQGNQPTEPAQQTVCSLYSMTFEAVGPNGVKYSMGYSQPDGAVFIDVESLHAAPIRKQLSLNSGNDPELYKAAQLLLKAKIHVAEGTYGSNTPNATVADFTGVDGRCIPVHVPFPLVDEPGYTDLLDRLYNFIVGQVQPAQLPATIAPAGLTNMPAPVLGPNTGAGNGTATTDNVPTTSTDATAPAVSTVAPLTTTAPVTTTGPVTGPVTPVTEGSADDFALVGAVPAPDAALLVTDVNGKPSLLKIDPASDKVCAELRKYVKDIDCKGPKTDGVAGKEIGEVLPGAADAVILRDPKSKDDLEMKKTDEWVCETLAAKGVNIVCNEKPSTAPAGLPQDALLVLFPDNGGIEFAIDRKDSKVCEELTKLGVAVGCVGAHTPNIVGASKNKDRKFDDMQSMVVLTRPDGKVEWAGDRTSLDMCKSLAARNVNIKCAEVAPVELPAKTIYIIKKETMAAKLHFKIPSDKLSFATGKHDIQPASQTKLKALAKVLDQIENKYANAISRVILNGAADQSPMSNQMRGYKPAKLASLQPIENCNVLSGKAKLECIMTNNFHLSSNRADEVTRFIRKSVTATGLKPERKYQKLGLGPVKKYSAGCKPNTTCDKDRFVEISFDLGDDVSEANGKKIEKLLTDVIKKQFGAPLSEEAAIADSERFWDGLEEALQSL